MTTDGLPDFAMTTVAVTEDERENGVQYLLAEADLAERGFEEPMVHFDGVEAPPFLVPAVCNYLHISADGATSMVEPGDKCANER